MAAPALVVWVAVAAAATGTLVVPVSSSVAALSTVVVVAAVDGMATTLSFRTWLEGSRAKAAMTSRNAANRRASIGEGEPIALLRFDEALWRSATSCSELAMLRAVG
ncbi:MAG: hypothetical protein ACPGWR_10715 [Ardenticatenaceae bacterium]